jgi:hypothetical protein
MKYNEFMVKLVQQPYGSDIALGIYGNTREEIQIEANNLYNYGVTNSMPHYYSDNFAYVLTSQNRILKGFTDRYLVDMQEGVTHRCIENGVRISKLPEMAKEKAEKIVEKIMDNREDFIIIDN